jgi:hypothetical protein
MPLPSPAMKVICRSEDGTYHANEQRGGAAYVRTSHFPAHVSAGQHHAGLA